MILIAVAYVLSSLWQLIMGKVKGGLYFYSTADILTEVFQKCPLSRPLPNVRIMSKPLNLIGYNDNRKDKYAKEYLKTHLLRNIHNVCLYKRYVFIAVEKSDCESRSSLLSHCRYFAGILL